MKLKWDEVGERFYENGVDQGVLFPWSDTANATWYGTGVAWNGLTKVTESPSGAEPTKLYADNMNYLTLMSNEEFAATLEAYTYPDEFAACDGSLAFTASAGVLLGQQKRKRFAFSYRTKVGNDIDPDLGYKIHLVYGCLAKPSSKDNNTINDSPEAATMSWEVSTTPLKVEIEGFDFRPTAHIEIDSTKFTTQEAKAQLAALEDYLYGTDGTGNNTGTAPQMPTIEKLIEIFGALVAG